MMPLIIEKISNIYYVNNQFPQLVAHGLSQNKQITNLLNENFVISQLYIMARSTVPYSIRLNNVFTFLFAFISHSFFFFTNQGLFKVYN